MKRSVKKAISLLICMAMIIAVAAVASFALPATPNCTAVIDITSDTVTVNKLSTEGWAWDASTHTLTIDGMYQSLASGVVNKIHFGDNTDINVVIKGENKIECSGSDVFYIETTGNVTINGSGTLNVTTTFNWPDCFHVQKAKSLTVNDISIDITQINNNISQHNGVFYICRVNNVTFDNVSITGNINVDVINAYGDDLESFSVKNSTFDITKCYKLFDIENYKDVTIDNCNITVGTAETSGTEYEGLDIYDDENLTLSNCKLTIHSNYEAMYSEACNCNITGCTIDALSDEYSALYFWNCNANISNSTVSAVSTIDEDTDYTLNQYYGGIVLDMSDLKVSGSTVKASGPCGGIISIRYNYDIRIAQLDPDSDYYEEALAYYTKIKTNHPFETPVISFENSDLTVSCAEGFLPVMFAFSNVGDDENFNINDYKDTLKPSFIFNNMKAITTGIMSTAALQGIDDGLFAGDESVTANNNTAIYGITATGAAPTFNYTTHTFTNGAVLAQFLSKGVFELNGGTLAESSMVSGSVINKTAGTPVKKGYTFGGWYYDKELTKPVKDGDTYTAGMVLYAKWIAATGDNTEMGAIAAIGVFSILGMGLVIKKRK